MSVSNGSHPVDVPRELQSVRVLGLGMAGVDILANVPSFPRPDDKIRTTSVSMLGGGNTANQMTALRRLGIPCALVSKVGKDVYGDAAMRELERDGIDTSRVVVKDGVNTSFTYVIVDSKANTRTCIATVSNEDLLVTEIHESMLDGVSLLALDGRHTLAALQLAKHARQKQIPILLDVERDRPYIRDLLPYADYIITNKTYPFVFFPDASSRIDAMEKLLEDCDAKLVISTLGDSGSVLVRRDEPRKRGTGHDILVQSDVVRCHRTSKKYEVIECPAWPAEEIVDSTGAGDAFIGGVLYGLLTGMDYERMLSLASHIAAEKLKGIGSRSALPRRENVPDMLLASLPSM